MGTTTTNDVQVTYSALADMSATTGRLAVQDKVRPMGGSAVQFKRKLRVSQGMVQCN